MSCVNFFTPESSFVPTDKFTDYPPFLCDPNMSTMDNIGTEVMYGMILNQYEDSTKLHSYMLAYIEEMDQLLMEIRNVELGRYIANAIGEQLDIIGIILQQSRALNINLDREWFGFVGADGALKMADMALPFDGGYFRGEEDSDSAILPLNDIEYRQLLLCRAYCLNQKVFSIPVVYRAITILLGYTPAYIAILPVTDASGNTLLDTMKVEFRTGEVTDTKLLTILTVSHWFIPCTKTLLVETI